MTSKQPPRFATWMLKHFGSGPDNDTVLGDLAEQYVQNGSASWYRRQALKAIWVSLFREIRAHKGSAVVALLTGWVLWAFNVTSIFPLITPYFFNINPDGPTIGVAIRPSDPIGSVLTVLSAPVRLHAALNQPFSFAFAVALPFVAWALIGGLVAIIANLHLEANQTGLPPRAKVTIGFHRDRQTAAVFLFAGSTLLLNLLLTGYFVLHLQMLVHGPSQEWSSAFGHLAAYVAASVVGILLGGTLMGGLLHDKSTVVRN